MLTIYRFFKKLFNNPKDPEIEIIMLCDKLTCDQLEEIANYCMSLKRYKELK